MATKGFLSIIFGIFIIIVSIVMDSKTRNKDVLKKERNFIKLTKIVEPSLNVSPYENRFLYLTKNYNRVYPQFQEINTMEFAYAK